MNMEQENNKEKLGPEFLHSNEYQEKMKVKHDQTQNRVCLLYTSPSPRDA